MNKKLFIVLFFSFILATIIGTLTHEFGHYIVAKAFGYKAQIHYAFTSWNTDLLGETIPFRHSFFIALAGPVQTMLTGTIGLFLLFFYRNSFFAAKELSFKQWLIIFVALFWLRQTANFVVLFTRYFLTGEFSLEGDEVRMAQYLNLPMLSLSAITALFGLLILGLISVKFIPVNQRISFLLAGLSGGITGYLLWLLWFGRYILP